MTPRVHGSHIQDYNRSFELLWWNLAMLYGRWNALQNDRASPRMTKPRSHSIKELYVVLWDYNLANTIYQPLASREPNY